MDWHEAIMAPAKPPPVAVRYHHGDLRAALIDAAERLLVEEGDWTFTLRAVARAAGVSHNAPYNHFQDKRALLAALATRGFLALADAIESIIAATGHVDVARRIEAAATGYVMFAVDQPARFRLMFSSELAGEKSEDLLAATSAAFGTLRVLIADGVASGELRPDATTTHALAAWSLVHGLSGLIIDGRAAVDLDRPAVAELARHVGQTLVNGLRSDRR